MPDIKSILFIYLFLMTPTVLETGLFSYHSNIGIKIKDGKIWKRLMLDSRNQIKSYVVSAFLDFSCTS